MERSCSIFFLAWQTSKIFEKKSRSLKDFCKILRFLNIFKILEIFRDFGQILLNRATRQPHNKQSQQRASSSYTDRLSSPFRSLNLEFVTIILLMLWLISLFLQIYLGPGILWLRLVVVKPGFTCFYTFLNCQASVGPSIRNVLLGVPYRIYSVSYEYICLRMAEIRHFSFLWKIRI